MSAKSNSHKGNECEFKLAHGKSYAINHRVSEFALDGTFIRIFAGTMREIDEGRYSVPGSEDDGEFNCLEEQVGQDRLASTVPPSG